MYDEQSQAFQAIKLKVENLKPHVENHDKAKESIKRIEVLSKSRSTAKMNLLSMSKKEADEKKYKYEERLNI